jgi:hypothetical protein
MGMAYVVPFDDTVRRSKAYPNCWYCPSCDATYTPGLTWGYRWSPRGSTNPSEDRWANVHKKGDECPFCGRKPG